jgi:hypothetical protein
MTEFKKWEDFTEKEQLLSMISDTHKDVYGVRWRGFNNQTVDELKEILDSLYVAAEEEMNFQKERQEEAIKEFEKTLLNVCVTCACSRSTAIRYLKDAEGDDWYDDGHFEYSNNLPYGYLKSNAI